MPTSDHRCTRTYIGTLKRVASLVGIALTTGVGLLWLNQHAIERYWQLTHHAPSPFSTWSSSFWQAGAQLEDNVQGHLQQLEQWLTPAQDITADTPLVDDNLIDDNKVGDDDSTTGSELAAIEAPRTAATSNALTMDDISGQPASQGRPLDIATAQPTSLATQAPASPTNSVAVAPVTASPAANTAPVSEAQQGEHPHSIVLSSKDRVLFIGDSMMQGVAPHVMKTLLKQYHVQSTNLSLQSTGLTYPGAFDWPGTLRSTLANTSNIKVLVVFLGPNDPWDMPSRAHSPYLKFKSPAWEAEYRSRIRNILEQAKARDIAVIWIGPPAMKRVALSEGVRFLDTLYQSEVEASGQYYIAVDDLFGYQDHRYSEPMIVNGRQVKLRSDDGTHFTVTGQKLIAHAVLGFLQPEPQGTAASDGPHAPTADGQPPPVDAAPVGTHRAAE